jgi:hypothetical protein
LALGIVGLLFLLSATSAWQSITTGDKPCVFSQSTADHTTLSRDLMLCVLVAVLHSAGAFILYSCFAASVKSRLGLTLVQLRLLFAWLGPFEFLGNVCLSCKIDHAFGLG